VAWHDIECRGYEADLPLWRELAESAGGPVLELGAGTGRVALDLAARGHDVVALDADPALVDACAARAREGGLRLEAVCADARAFALGRRFALVLAPMQVVQLLVDAAGRVDQELDDLHRSEDEREAATESKGPGIGAHGLEAEAALAGAGGAGVDQGRIGVEGNDIVASRREVEGDATGARAQLEDRPARALGELPPQREVGLVATALDVVPRHSGIERGRGAARPCARRPHGDRRLARSRSGAMMRTRRSPSRTVTGTSPMGSPSA